jgi:hypothetical protein
MLSADGHRLTSRSRTFNGGTIRFNCAGTINCVYPQFSARCLFGSREPVRIPDDFELRRQTETRSCHVVLRKKRRVGVRFI